MENTALYLSCYFSHTDGVLYCKDGEKEREERNKVDEKGM